MGKQADKRTGRDRERHARSAERGSTTEHYRDEMPSGRTMGRSSARDPAAAPLDADDEASGHPATDEAVRQERDRLRERPSAGTGEPGAGEPDDYKSARGQAFAAVAVVLLLVLGAAVLWLAMR